jgi:hypothetical protein
MSENYINNSENISIKQIELARKSCEDVMIALREGKIDKEVALNLLNYSREQLNNAYNQRIEMLIEMKHPYENIESMKFSELSSLDKYVGDYLDSQQKDNSELEALFR